MLFLLIFVYLIHSIELCPLTDNYLSRCHCGILTNGESYIKCNEQTLDEMPIFKRSFPYDELILSNNNIKNLTQSSFDQIKTIKRINLENNSLSFIDKDLLRLVGNYLEELALTGDKTIDSLEFLTRYPLKKLRVLKLNNFNLKNMNLNKIFQNMTKLELVYLRSCQIEQIPDLPSYIQILDMENNDISDQVYLSTPFIYLNLAFNSISSIIVENNSQLISLNLANNHLNEFIFNKGQNRNLNYLNLSSNLLTSFDFSMLNDNLTHINLNNNRLLSINFNQYPKYLVQLSLKNNLIKQIKYPTGEKFSSSLSSLDLSENQLKSIENNILFTNLNNLNLDLNPLECDCHLQWLKDLVLNNQQINASTWTCSSLNLFLLSNFQCSTTLNPRIVSFNISYIKLSSEYGLYIQWSITDEYNILDYLQISISDPYYISPKFRSNQTKIFLSNQIQSNKQYHICLILVHKYARDKYCREYVTDKLPKVLSNEVKFDKLNQINLNQQYDMNLYMMLIGSCLGGLITFLLIITCCYLCLQVYKIHLTSNTNHRTKNKSISYYSTNANLHYPIYHSYSTTCPYHHENISNSTDISQIDSSLSTTNLKHIYQTIDSHDYSSLKRDTQLFDLWNESMKHNR